MKEVDLTNRESFHHDVGQLTLGSYLPYVLVSNAIIHAWQHGTQRADVFVPVADMDCVHILHERACLGQEVPPVVRHVTGLHLCEDVGDEALEVSILLQCHMSNNGGLLGETLRI